MQSQDASPHEWKTGFTLVLHDFSAKPGSGLKDS